MKYRMQENEMLGGMKLMDGDICVPPTYMNLCQYHEAAVEFWREIERLRSERDELMAACKMLRKVMIADNDWPTNDEIGQLENAIANAEVKSVASATFADREKAEQSLRAHGAVTIKEESGLK